MRFLCVKEMSKNVTVYHIVIIMERKLCPDCTYLKPFRMRLIGYLLGGISIYSTSFCPSFDVTSFYDSSFIAIVSLPCLRPIGYGQKIYLATYVIHLQMKFYIYIYIYIYISRYNTQTYKSTSIYSYVNTFIGIYKLQKSFF